MNFSLKSMVGFKEVAIYNLPLSPFSHMRQEWQYLN